MLDGTPRHYPARPGRDHAVLPPRIEPIIPVSLRPLHRKSIGDCILPRVTA